MAHAIDLTDGTNTVNLYDFATTFVLSDGWELAGSNVDEEIGESINLLIQGASGAAIQMIVRNIDRLLETARRWARTGVGPRVYLRLSLDGMAEVRRTLVVDGELLAPLGVDQWGRRKIEATLSLLRKNFWEDNSETELQLSAASQSAATGGRTVTNAANAWATISSGQVLGSIPAPLRLEMTNTAGTGRVITEVHIACNADHDPANFGFLVEGETATGGSSTSNASCSGGSARSLTVNTSDTLTFALSAANMQRAKGAPFLVLARFQSVASGGVTVRAELKSGGVTVWRANEPRGIERTTPHLAVLGVVPLPPNLWEATPAAGIDLVLNFESSASRTVVLDYLAFLPANNYRLLTLLGASVANNGVIHDNGIEGWAGVLQSSVMLPIASPRGAPITVRPNTTQRLVFFWHTSTDCLVADTFSVKAFYRPRSVSL